MADYYSPTVIQPAIPIADMSPLELLLLTLVFDFELDGDAVYLFAKFGPSDIVTVLRKQLAEAHEVSRSAVGSTASVYIANKLPKDADDQVEQPDDIDIDMTGTSWEFILQDIVRRSTTLKEIVVTTSFTCNRMRPDGFGGAICLITADQIMEKSTSGADIQRQCAASAEHRRHAAKCRWNGKPVDAVQMTCPYRRIFGNRRFQCWPAGSGFSNERRTRLRRTRLIGV